MNDYITIDSPNIPLLSPLEAEKVPYGTFVDSCGTGNCPPESEVFNLSCREMYLPNFSLREFKGNFKKDVVFRNLHAGGSELPGSCLLLEADVVSSLADGSKRVNSYSRSQNFKFDPQNEYLHSMRANTALHYFHVSYEPGYLFTFLPENMCWADHLRQAITKRERIFADHYKPLTIPQFRAIQNIVDSPFSGKLGIMMVEASVTQVVLLQLYELFAEKTELPGEGLKPQERDIAEALRNYLDQTFLDDHSIAGLSKYLGVNTNKLMCLFRRRYSKSIFEYIGELRMKYAVHLLQQEDTRVIDVAKKLGYKNPNHFSTAFKRTFGVNPTEYKYQPVLWSVG